jgi:glycosyltransferase involved in cell wall biosynthesis
MQMRGGHPVPYHVVPGPAPDKRILLISYHAPPSNEVGALRWAGMAPHFAARGWGFDILALDPAALRSRNESLLGALPPGTRLFGIPDDLPAFDRVVDRVVDLRRRVRAGLKVSVPPPAGAELASDSTRRPLTRRSVVNAFHAWREYAVGARWARRAAKAGRGIFVPGVHRWVASTAPPQMSHEGGRLLSVWTGLPFLADFRDPWRFSEWVSLGPAWLRLAERYEVPVVAQSTLTVVNVEPVRRIMQEAYPNARVVTITNGVDEAPIPAAPSGRRFIIGYPGGIYLGRDPAPVFEAVGMMVRELDLRPEQLGLEFMGFFEPHVEARLVQLAAAHGIEPFVAVHPGRPRPEALQFMTTCAVLVALQQGSDLAIPAKLFEYMRYPAWLLVVAGRESATAQLLAGTTALVHDPADTAGIRAALTARFHEFQSGTRPQPLGDEERFSRRFQTGLLLEAMEQSRSIPAPTPA